MSECEQPGWQCLPLVVGECDQPGWSVLMFSKSFVQPAQGVLNSSSRPV